MSEESMHYVAAGAILAGAAGLLYWYDTTGFHLISKQDTPVHTITRVPMTTAELREDFIASHKYHTPPANTSGLREIPIVGMRTTPFSLGQQLGGGSLKKIWEVPAAWRDALAQQRQALIAAGRGNEDVRAVMFRWMEETLWGTRCWNYNSGNRKARPYATPEMIRAGTVLTSSPYAASLFILKDTVSSIDGYYGYSDWTGNARAEGDLFRSHYPGVLEAYAQGELSGLLIAAQIQQRLNYTDQAGNPAANAQDQQHARNYWDGRFYSGARVLGADWVR